MTQASKTADCIELPFERLCHYCERPIRRTSLSVYRMMAQGTPFEDLSLPDELLVHWPSRAIQCEDRDTRASNPPVGVTHYGSPIDEDEDYIYYGSPGMGEYRGNPYGLYGGYL